MKKLFKSKLFKTIGPILRGVLKQVPVVGTPIAEALTNLSQPIGDKKKHSTVSMVTQWLCVAAIVLSFYMKWITLADLLDFFGWPL